MDMSRIAKQEDAIPPEGIGDTMMDVVGRKPECFRHTHVAGSLDFGTDVLEGEIMSIHEVGRNDADDPIVVLARHGKKAEEALLAEPDAELILDLVERALHVRNEEALGVGSSWEIDAGCLAPCTASAIAAA